MWYKNWSKIIDWYETLLLWSIFIRFVVLCSFINSTLTQWPKVPSAADTLTLELTFEWGANNFVHMSKYYFFTLRNILHCVPWHVFTWYMYWQAFLSNLNTGCQEQVDLYLTTWLPQLHQLTVLPVVLVLNNMAAHWPCKVTWPLGWGAMTWIVTII